MNITIIKKYLVLALAVFLLIPAFVFGETITNFESNIVLETDSSFTVTETISYDFEGVERRGIFRFIPLVYETEEGPNRLIDISVQEVLRSGQTEPFVVSREDNYLSIRIGDENQYLDGTPETYVISYTVEGGVSYFENVDELYWDVTGDQWEIDIQSATTNITFPGGQFISATCYRGVAGSGNLCGEFESASTSYSFTAADIAPGSGMTVAAGIEKGTLPVVLMYQEEMAGWLKTLIILLVVGLPLGGTLVFIYALWRANKKHAIDQPLIAQYESYDGVLPLFAGSLIDQRLDTRDMVAGLLSLAQRGYLQLERTEEKVLLFSSTDWNLQLVRLPDSHLSEAERILIDFLFGKDHQKGQVLRMSKLVTSKNHKKKYDQVTAMREHVQERLRTEGYTEKFWGGTRYTKKGFEAQNHLKGLKLYVSVAEKDRIDFHNAPEKNPQRFMELLPYAVAFGVEKKWAEQFKGIEISDPDWLVSHGHGIYPVLLVNDLNQFSQSFGSNVAQAAPSSGGSAGGGFSGGGVGGGGGGSW